MYLARGPWDSYSGWPFGSRIFFSFWVETGSSSLYIYILYIYIAKATSYPYLSLHLSHIHAGGVALIALGWLVYLSLHLSHIHAGGVALIALGWLISDIPSANGPLCVHNLGPWRCHSENQSSLSRCKILMMYFLYQSCTCYFWNGTSYGTSYKVRLRWMMA